MPALTNLHGLLGLIWLSPQDPNFLDRTFGRFASQEFNRDNSIHIALLMLGLLLLALLWRGLRQRKFDLLGDGQAQTLIQRVGLEPVLAKPAVLQWGNRVVTAALVVVALLASVNYFYGTRNNGVYVHRWDAFHTVIGVKYHHELGYFDLYKCAYAIDKEGPRHFRSVKDIRDLRTRKFVPANEHIQDNDCKERFTPERLAEFKHDLDEFGTWSSKSQWKILMKDKGFNGTPFYATVCKLLIGTIDVTLEDLKKLAVIDPVLMFIAFGVVGWAFGARQAAIVAIFYCVFFPNRFTHMGGSILRFDYAATLLVGLAALKKDKWGLAGAMFAWASMVRVFPAIFAVGVGLKIASDVIHKRKLVVRPEHWRFFGWYFGLIALFFVISLIGMDGGVDNWRTWYENMRIHNARSASYRIGFKHLWMFDGTVKGSNYNLKHQNLADRQLYYWVSTIVLIAPILLSVRRLDKVSFTAMFGVFGFFLATYATRYYYGVVALLFLVDRELLSNRYMLMLGVLLFGSTTFDFVYFELNDNDPFMYNIIIGVELTIALAMVGSWLLFNPALHDAELPTGATAGGGTTRPESEIQTVAGLEPTSGTQRLLAAIAAEQAPPVYDPHAVTISDVHRPDPENDTVPDPNPFAAGPDKETVPDPKPKPKSKRD